MQYFLNTWEKWSIIFNDYRLDDEVNVHSYKTCGVMSWVLFNKPLLKKQSLEDPDI
jgi:hypothetical protein